MNTERTFKILLMDLTNDSLKLEEEVERTINSDMDITIKTNKLKEQLSKMVSIESSIKKLTQLIGTINNIEEKKE